MDSWNGTGDQYVVDTDSRYPLFSDIQTTDYAISPVRINKNKAKKPSTEKFESTQKCNCVNCIHKNDSQIEKYTSYESVNQRLHRLQLADNFQPSLNFDNITMDNTTIIIMFMFLLIVFICCFFNNAVGELKSQIKLLKQIIKNKPQ
ncbi:Hypothetical protein PACV_235 [Pacmanvirus A23]|uniref:Hypothetical protein n=1 Tax=Pacmanvirus A23 TaxID=1932881 RepID=UPI000A0956B0|nr:Hypothetical protein B9W72_gp233 [Pacmanvirus A23]SIP85950.1 Hypothetical protein PACV_235 [Pacmanvirus A23]